MMRPPQSGADVDAIATEWRVKVAQAAQVAKIRTRGNVPAWLQRLLGDLTAPTVDWRDILRGELSALGLDDFSYARPDRRFISSDIYQPHMISEDVGKIVVAVDTSGSIGDVELTRMLSEVTGVLQSVNFQELHLLYVDAELAAAHIFQSFDILTSDHPPVGGGGTSFRPAFKYAAAQQADILIYLTDGEGSLPSSVPEYPVIWCVILGVEQHIRDYLAPYERVLEIV